VVSNVLDYSLCTFSNFEFNTTGYFWFDNQTMQLVTGTFAHALPPVNFPNSNGTWTAREQKVIVTGNSKCCRDTNVPKHKHPTDPGLFHDFGVYEETMKYHDNGTDTDVFSVGPKIKYGVPLSDGSPVFFKSLDFYGLWNFTSNFDTDTEFDFPKSFLIPPDCNISCNCVPRKDEDSLPSPSTSTQQIQVSFMILEYTRRR